MTKCGWASIDENGHASYGKAGDQTETGREVKTGDWYQFGQTAVYRWKNRNYAEKYAKIIKSFCDNKNIGYDQNQRTTLGYWCKHHKWSYEVNTPVETDCSRMVADAINCTMKREVIPLNSTFYTGNLGDVLMRTDLFTKLTGDKYTDSPDHLMVGDIINNPARHVISALENGKKIVSGSTQKSKTVTGASTIASKAKAKTYDGTFPVLPAKGYLREGDLGTQVKRLQQFLNWYGGYGLEIDGSFGIATKTALKAFQKSTGLVSDGFFGPASLKKAKAVRK